MPVADTAMEFVLRLCHAEDGGLSGTLRAIGTQDGRVFEGWIGLISLITEWRETAVDHATTMRSTYERINRGDIDGFGDLLSDDFVEHDEVPGLPPTKAGVLDYFRLLLSAFPDMQMNVQDIISGGDKTVARLTARATHKGEFMGVPATGNSVEIRLIDIMGFDDRGLVCEHWGVADMLSLMQQIGVVPA